MLSQSLVTSAWHYFWPAARPPESADWATVVKIREAMLRLESVSDRGLAEQVNELRADPSCESNADRVARFGPTRPSGRTRDRSTPAGPLGNSAAPGGPEMRMFPLVIEAARRVLGITLFDVQLLAGLALSRGAIAEMQTGEGKTFTALLPACLHALSGNGVHLMTVNAYLAERDCQTLAPVYQLLGLTVGRIDADMEPHDKRIAYACDITYGPGYEFGFDYLRDQLALFTRRQPRLGVSFLQRLQGRGNNGPQTMQRGHAVAIVDEADSVMLDEATTPLILSSGGDQPATNAEVYEVAARAAAQLEPDAHFLLNESERSLRLTPLGVAQLTANPENIPRRGLDRPWPIYVEQALRSEHLFRRDVHYVVRNDKIELVDQNTGRIFADRSWSDGLQQAVQAKEGVRITGENKSVARISRQRYLRLYRHLCGMTGTARGAERELRDVYGRRVVVIPPHRQCRRIMLPTRYFADGTAKERAIVAEVERIHRNRQPVLVGTAAIETSERIANLLIERRISLQLLNGKQDAAEAVIVACAGEPGAVTIATNMAGRGTDIKLGPGVADLGGLHVIATEPQSSTRVDRQLIGRAARQGDCGSFQLFTSADDELFIRHATELADRIRLSADASGEAQVELSREIVAVQRRVERDEADQRRSLFAHDDWLEEVLENLAATT